MTTKPDISSRPIGELTHREIGAFAFQHPDGSAQETGDTYGISKAVLTEFAAHCGTDWFTDAVFLGIRCWMAARREWIEVRQKLNLPDSSGFLVAQKDLDSKLEQLWHAVDVKAKGNERRMALFGDAASEADSELMRLRTGIQTVIEAPCRKDWCDGQRDIPQLIDDARVALANAFDVIGNTKMATQIEAERVVTTTLHDNCNMNWCSVLGSYDDRLDDMLIPGDPEP